MGRGNRERIRGELGEGRGGGGGGNRLGESGIGIVRRVGGILEREQRVGELI